MPRKKLLLRNKFPNCGRTKEIIYRGYTIHFYEDAMCGVKLGNVSIYGPDRREVFHATLSEGAALEDQTEQNARDTVDEFIDGTFPPTACE